jgi:hypothetical protein
MTYQALTRCQAYFGSDYPYTLPIPQNDQVVMSMDIKSSQYPAIGNATDIEWLTLTSTNIGWARLGPSRRLFQPSFFHEQHCLRQIVLGLNHVPNAPISHVRHCLQYLRQMALCQSDLTLEPVSGNPEDIFEWDTSAGSHKCKDWTLPMEKMEQNLREWQKYLGNH